MIPLVKVLMPPPDTLMPALEQVLYSGMIAEGEAVYAFEKAFAQKFGHREALALNSGTAALHLALLLCGVEPGDEVITTSMTAEPTNTTIIQLGAHPVFSDVDPATGNLSPDSVESLIGERTAAICVVHYAGYPADIEALRAIADRRGIALVEDCAHALGAMVGDRPIGTFGDAAIFSLQAIKHMTTVDGGMLIARDPTLIDEARRLRWFGLSKGVPRTEVDIKRAGFKYNMSNVAATIGLHQLDQIDAVIARHKENGRFLDRELAQLPAIAPCPVAANADPSYWLYTLRAENSDHLIARLEAAGIGASKLHRPNHLHSVFAPYRRSLPGLDAFYADLVHLPCGWWVEPDQRRHIIDTIKAA
jgi:dTDP-4-amino-4,6-dideoxygalactose transaminase